MPKQAEATRAPAALRRHILHGLGMGMIFIASPAYAQYEAFNAPTPLTVKMADENGVDVLAGQASFAITDAAIADFTHVKTVSTYNTATQPQPYAGTSPTAYDNFIGGLGYADNRDYSHFNPAAWFPRPSYSVRVGEYAATFYINQNHSLESFDGSTLTGTNVQTWAPTSSAGRDHPVVLDSGQGIWIFGTRDGTQIEIDTNKRPTVGQFARYLGAATKITAPNGMITRINYKASCGTARVQSVTRNDGLMFKYTYSDGTCGAYPTGVIAINTAYEYCDPMADTCGVSSTWRRSQYGYDWNWVSSRSLYNVTDQRGNWSRFTMDKWGRVASYKPPGHNADLLSFRYCLSYFTSVNTPSQNYPPTLSENEPGKADSDEIYCGEMVAPAGMNYPAWWNDIYNRVVTVSRGGLTWTYTRPMKLAPGDSPYPRQYQIIRPVGPTTYVNINTQPGGGLTGFIDPAQAIIAYSDPEKQRMASGQMRGGPQMTFTYDARGNVLSNGITSADYDTVCTYVVKCNKPNAVRNAANKQADYTYSTTHGGVLTETLPADTNGVRPQKRYAYVQRYAWFLNSSAVMTRSTEPIWLLASMSYCRTSAASGSGCSAANDEVVTTYDYGPDSGPNNLWLRGVVVTADGQSLRTCYGYNKFGDKISETTPRAGLGVCP